MDSEIETFGYNHLGPYLVSFCQWLREQSQKYGTQTCLLFVARDGYLPHLVYRTLYPEESSHSYYTLASRVSAQLALVHDHISAARWLKGMRTSSVLPASLEHESDVFAPLTSLLGDDRDLSDKFLLKRVLELSACHREIYRDYLSEIVQDRYPIVVDIGYGGSTQSCFASLLECQIDGLYLATHRRARGEAAKAGLVRAFDANFIRPHSRRSMINRYRYLFETILSESAGSFLFFDGVGRPIFESFEGAATSSCLLGQIRQGVLRYATEVASDERPVIGRMDAETSLLRFLEAPTAKEAAAFSGLSFNDSLKGVDRRYIVIPKAERQFAYGLWIEGQLVLDEASNNVSTELRRQFGLRCEDAVLKRILSTANYASYATNRKKYLLENRGLPFVLLTAVRKNLRNLI